MQPTHDIMYSHLTLWVSRKGGECGGGGKGMYLPPYARNRTTDPGAVTFYYTVPIPGSVAAKQPTK